MFSFVQIQNEMRQTLNLLLLLHSPIIENRGGKYIVYGSVCIPTTQL